MNELLSFTDPFKELTAQSEYLRLFLTPDAAKMIWKELAIGKLPPAEKARTIEEIEKQASITITLVAERILGKEEYRQFLADTIARPSPDRARMFAGQLHLSDPRIKMELTTMLVSRLGGGPVPPKAA